MRAGLPPISLARAIMKSSHSLGRWSGSGHIRAGPYIDSNPGCSGLQSNITVLTFRRIRERAPSTPVRCAPAMTAPGHVSSIRGVERLLCVCIDLEHHFEVRARPHRLPGALVLLEGEPARKKATGVERWEGDQCLLEVPGAAAHRPDYRFVECYERLEIEGVMSIRQAEEQQSRAGSRSLQSGVQRHLISCRLDDEIETVEVLQ